MTGMAGEWFAAAGRIVGLLENLETVYRVTAERYPTREAAIAAGFDQLDASDDFNVGRVVNGELVWFGWMDEQHPIEDYPQVAVDLGLVARGGQHGK